jgi:acetyltransferase
MISYALTDYSRNLRAELPGLAFLQESEKAIRAVRSAIDYVDRTAQPPAARAPVPERKRRARVAAILHRHKQTSGPATLSEIDSKALLKAYGLRCPQEAIAKSASEAVAIARRIGYPVVAKAVGAALAHKTEMGGVVLGLDSDRRVRAAYADIVRTVKKRAGIALDGVLIAEQVTGGLELLLGATRDPEVGPVIMFGTGGVDLELYRDVALAAAPLDEAGAHALIDRTRAGKLIAGYRGRAALDRKSLVRALTGLSQLVIDAGSALQSIDINPFLLKERGGVALDALVVLADSAEA